MVGVTWPENAALQVEQLAQKYEVRGRPSYYVVPSDPTQAPFVWGPFDSSEVAERRRDEGARPNLAVVEGDWGDHANRARAEFKQDLSDLVERWSEDEILPRDVREQYVEPRRGVEGELERLDLGVGGRA